jgi:replicative DNA helicase
MKNKQDVYNNFKNFDLGFKLLDKHLQGVLPGIYVIGASPSFGKTTLMLQIADYIASKGRKVLYYSLEMNKFEMFCKSFSRIAYQTFNLDLSVRDIMFYNCDIDKLNNVYNTFGRNIEIIEGTFSMIYKDLENSIKYHLTTIPEKFGISAVFIDSLQSINVDDYDLTDKMKVDYNITALKHLSNELSMPIFLTSILNRSSYNQDLNITAFKESGSIEYTADVLFGLQGAIVDELKNYPTNSKADIQGRNSIGKKYKKYTENTGIIPTKLKCLKNRFGEKDFNVKLDFKPKNNIFFESLDQSDKELDEYSREITPIEDSGAITPIESSRKTRYIDKLLEVNEDDL